MIFVYAEIGKTGAFSKFMISPFADVHLTENECVNTYFTHLECKYIIKCLSLSTNECRITLRPRQFNNLVFGF